MTTPEHLVHCTCTNATPRGWISCPPAPKSRDHDLRFGSNPHAPFPISCLGSCSHVVFFFGVWSAKIWLVTDPR